MSLFVNLISSTKIEFFFFVKHLDLIEVNTSAKQIKMGTHFHIQIDLCVIGINGNWHFFSLEEQLYKEFLYLIKWLIFCRIQWNWRQIFTQFCNFEIYSIQFNWILYICKIEWFNFEVNQIGFVFVLGFIGISHSPSFVLNLHSALHHSHHFFFYLRVGNSTQIIIKMR